MLSSLSYSSNSHLLPPIDYYYYNSTINSIHSRISQWVYNIHSIHLESLNATLSISILMAQSSRTFISSCRDHQGCIIYSLDLAQAQLQELLSSGDSDLVNYRKQYNAHRCLRMRRLNHGLYHSQSNQSMDSLCSAIALSSIKTTMSKD